MKLPKRKSGGHDFWFFTNKTDAEKRKFFKEFYHSHKEEFEEPSGESLWLLEND